KPSPQGTGVTITFTASASGGTAPYQYKWWLWNGSAWNVVQDWSASPTFAWRPTKIGRASCREGGERSAGNAADVFESYTQLAFPINAPSPAKLTGITPAKPSPQGTGVTITFTAAASGGTAPYQYKWWLWNGSVWNVVQDWSASPAFAWRPT